MAELELHHEAETHDPYGQRVGIQAALLAAALAIVTIASHRAHTSAVVHQSEANDQWSFFQSKKMRGHTLDLGTDLVALLGPKNEDSARLQARYAQEKKRYSEDAVEAQKKAEEFEHEAHHDEGQALRFDLGEGLLEIGLVLTSLFFISKKKLFPVIGILAGLAGAVIGISGWFL